MTLPELRLLALPLGIPEKGLRAYCAHRAGARRRGIEFLFTLPEWWAWWQLDGRWSRRGLGAQSLVMARRGDLGPYCASNVYPATHAENLRESVRRPRRERSRLNLPRHPHDDLRRPLGANIIRFRRAMGLSRKALAAAAGLSVTTVADMEIGRCNPTLNALCAVARVVQQPPHVLAAGVGVMPRAAAQYRGMSKRASQCV